MISMATSSAATVVDYNVIWAGLGAMPIVLLIALLVERELLATFGGARAAWTARLLNVGIVPLLAASAVILAVRFSRILGIM